MLTAQLINRREKVLSYHNGNLIENPTENQALVSAIHGESKVITTEEVVERWKLKSKKEANQRFWDFIESEKVDSRNYYVVFGD